MTGVDQSRKEVFTSKRRIFTARIRQQLDVFHHRSLRKILGITWKDYVTSMEVLSRTGQRRLQDIVADRRLRMAGHVIRMPPRRPANHAMSWTPRGSGRQRGRAGYGCYIGRAFAGVLAYADDVVLLAPSASAMRKMLALCDQLATEFSVVFNADKSKCIVVQPRRLSSLSVSRLNFHVGGSVIM